MTEIPATNEIVQYLHCKLCIEELEGILRRTGQPTSPQTYSRYSGGFSAIGVQLWCNRHQVNVAHVSFEGAVHPANLNRAT